jgi:hypothetical protein
MDDIIERLKPRLRKRIEKVIEEPVVVQERPPTPPKREILPYVRKRVEISDQTYSEVERQALNRLQFHATQLNPGKNFSMGWGRQDILVDDSLARLAKVHQYCETEFKDVIDSRKPRS